MLLTFPSEARFVSREPGTPRGWAAGEVGGRSGGAFFRRAMSGPAVAAAGIVRILDRRISSALRSGRGPCQFVNRRMCSKTQAENVQKPKPQASETFKIPGHKPTDWDKKMLLWTGRFKKAEDIPETVSFEMVDAARNKMRVRISYVMIALTVVGCITMVILGKQAVRRHESLTTQNLEKKARWREEAAQSVSAKP